MAHHRGGQFPLPSMRELHSRFFLKKCLARIAHIGLRNTFQDQGSSTAFRDYRGIAAAVEYTGFTKPASVYETNMNSNVGLPFSHNPEWMVATSNKAIKDAVVANKPFFLYHASTMPHGPMVTSAFTDFDMTKTPAGTVDQEFLSSNIGTFPNRTAMLQVNLGVCLMCTCAPHPRA